MENLIKANNFIGCESNYTESELVIFGAPYDGTTSYRPGARFAPAQMRAESFGIETYSPYLDMDLEDYKLNDAGDCDIPFGDRAASLRMIKEVAAKIINDSKKFVAIGGEHLITLSTFEAVYDKYPDVYVIHLDAHTDLREEYIGQKLSHASVIKRIWDIVGDGRIYQFGIRSGMREEFEFAQDGHTYLNKFNLNGLDEVVDRLKGKKVYLTIDLDVLDPSIFPGTGTPEAGGISFKELMQGIDIVKQLDIVSADVVELSPHYDTSGVSTAVACKVLREVMLAVLYK